MGKVKVTGISGTVATVSYRIILFFQLYLLGIPIRITINSKFQETLISYGTALLYFCATITKPKLIPVQLLLLCRTIPLRRVLAI